MGDRIESPKDCDQPPIWRPALVALLLLSAACLLLHRCHQPPAALGVDASPKKFSAERAFERLKDLLGDETPHPIGTPANLAVRARLLQQIDGLGLVVTPSTGPEWIQVPRTWITDVVRPSNIVVELPSAHPERDAIVLACHFDSVGAGPGASDDAAAVAAVLEVTRILLLRGPLPRPVILLFTDGEELGLYGARRFVQHNPLAKNAGIILNLEARGTSGGSLLFETSLNNRWMIRQAARGLKYPMTSSAYVDVYRFMPNSSDLAIFMGRKIHGMNFAYIDSPRNYHTPFDNLANLDHRSLQHHGENALGMVNQLLESDLEKNGSLVGDAVYTDLFARWIIGWPAMFGPTLSGLVFLLLVFSLTRTWKSNRLTWRAFLKAISCWLAINVAAVLLALLGLWLLKLIGAAPTWFPAHMHFEIWFVCLLGVLGVVVATFIPRVSSSLLFTIHALMLAAGALALSFSNVTGFSYLWLLPAVPAAIALFLNRHHELTGHRLFLSCLAVGFVTIVPWYPLLPRLPLALGVLVAPVLGAAIAMILLPFAPLLVPLRPKLKGAIALVLIAASGFFLMRSLQTPAFAPDSPQQIGLFYAEEAGSGVASLSILNYEDDAPLPAALTKDLEPVERSGAVFRPYGEQFSVTSAPVPPPEVTINPPGPASDDGTTRASITITSPVEAEHVLIGIPLSAKDAVITVQGLKLRKPPEGRDGIRWVCVRGTPASGLGTHSTIEASFSWPGSYKLPVVVVVARPGLPPHLDSFVTRRRELNACPAHLGDLSYSYQQIRISSAP